MECIDVCPKNCIRIQDDIFAYNAIKDMNICINCHACENKCPNNCTIEKKNPIYWKQGWAKQEIRTKSSSGGIASAVIKKFIESGGYVASCLFIGGEFRFEITNDLEFASKFAGSKYVKSNPAGIYKLILDKLKTDKVLFLGLPCQCAAVRKYTNDNDNLYTIDLICHGTPSPKILDRYLKEKNLELRDVNDVKFRNKNNFELIVNNRGVVPHKIQDFYTFAFLKGLDYTENCYSCNFASIERVSDITIGDSWGSELSVNEQNQGISLILCQTEKGISLINDSSLVLKDVDLDKAVKANHQLRHPSILPSNRETFFININHGLSNTIRKLYPRFYYKQIIKALLIKFKLL